MLHETLKSRIRKAHDKFVFQWFHVTRLYPETTFEEVQALVEMGILVWSTADNGGIIRFTDKVVDFVKSTPPISRLTQIMIDQLEQTWGQRWFRANQVMYWTTNLDRWAAQGLLERNVRTVRHPYTEYRVRPIQGCEEPPSLLQDSAIHNVLVRSLKVIQEHTNNKGFYNYRDINDQVTFLAHEELLKRGWVQSAKSKFTLNEDPYNWFELTAIV